MRILIAEEGIKKTSGHWYAYTDSIRRALIKAGHEVVIAAHKNADEEIIQLLDAHRTFRYSRWDGIYNSPYSFIRYCNVFIHNRRFKKDLNDFINEHGYFDHIFAGNNMVYHALAWKWIAKKYAGKAFGKLTLLFVQDAGGYNPVDKSLSFPRRSMLLRKVLKSFKKWIDNGSVEFAAETSVTAKQYEAFTNFPIRTYNHPTEIEYRKPNPTQRDPKKAVCFGCFGFARYEKGSDILQSAAAKFIELYPEANVKFLFQWNHDFDLPDGSVCSKNPKLIEDPRFRYIKEPLSGEGFTRFLDDTDVMAMPYRWSSYNSRLSRVTIESMIAGMPTIYTEDTWLDRAITRSGVGVGFQNENIESLVVALKKTYDQFEELNVKAYEHSKIAEDYYSGDSFAKLLTSE